MYRANSSHKPNEECGIFGIYNKGNLPTARVVYYGLYSLQHRGQESCGIAVNNDNHITCYKDLGLVSEVFDDLIINNMVGNMAIGHVRYSTTGMNTRENAQPLTAKYIKGTITIAHNGNISNAAKIRGELEQQGAVFQSTNDSEIIAFLIARERIKTSSIEDAVSAVVKQLEGSFSLLVMSPKKLIALRDPFGIRPLCMGKIENSYLFASESCALESVHATFIRDIKPGEMVVVTADSIFSKEDHCTNKSALCIFEHIYFARPDSILDGQSVYKSRILAGRILAKEHPVEADIVIGVPDSGIIAAIGYAQQAKIPYGEGLMKNRYIGRTFIQPNQALRELSVSIKLSALSCNVKGKRVVMIDDSIVRGTTIKQIVSMLKRAGAKEIHIRVSSPPFIWPCYYGTDISDRSQLACNNYSIEELCKNIGADSLGFLPLAKLREIAPHSNVEFCDACFSGNYPFEAPQFADKMAFEES